MPIRLKFKDGAEVVMNDLWLSSEEYVSMTRGELLNMVESAIEDEFRASGTLEQIVETIEYLDHRSVPGRTLEQMEKNHILAVLHENHGARKKTAEVLGINTSTLYRKLQAYGIASQEDSP